MFANSPDTVLVKGNTTGQPLDTAVAKANYRNIKAMYDQTIASPLGLGWGQSKPADAWGWITKLIGWLLTGVAVTLGAPFWFDLLKKLISIKGGSNSSSDNNSSAPLKAAQEPVFEIKPATQDGKSDTTETYG
jgi:hypothetical protein